MRIPSELLAGDSRTWSDDPVQDNQGGSIDSALWTLTYYLRGPSKLDLTAAADGLGWKTTLSAAASAALVAGVYYWQARAVKGDGSAFTIGNGRMTINPNLSAADQAYDGRSQNEKDLDAVQAAIRAMMTKGAVQEYTIQGRQLRSIPLPDLLVYESRLKFRVAKEQKASLIANGKGDPHSLYVRFKQ